MSSTVLPRPSVPAFPQEVRDQVGQLCISWSFLEIVSEQLVWGILEIDERIGQILTWRMDLRSRWQMILDHGSKKHSDADMAILRGINRDLVPVTRDRNIVVHGAVHYNWASKAICWTVFRGAEAGKGFPVSKEAVETIRANVRLLSDRTQEFNQKHGYELASTPPDDVETDWPKPLV